MGRRTTELVEITASDLRVGDRVGRWGWTVRRITRAPHVISAVSAGGRFALSVKPEKKLEVRRS